MSGALNTVGCGKSVAGGKNVYQRRSSYAANIIQAFCQIDKNNFIYVTSTSSWWGEKLASTMIKLGVKRPMVTMAEDLIIYFSKTK